MSETQQTTEPAGVQPLRDSDQTDRDDSTWRRVEPAAAYLAGAVAGLPLYYYFGWWDILAHAAGAVVLAILWLRQTRGALSALGGVTATAVAWEVVEPLIPATVTPGPIDAATDIGVAVIVAAIVLWWLTRDTDSRHAQETNR